MRLYVSVRVCLYVSVCVCECVRVARLYVHTVPLKGEILEFFCHDSALFFLPVCIEEEEAALNQLITNQSSRISPLKLGLLLCACIVLALH